MAGEALARDGLEVEKGTAQVLVVTKGRKVKDGDTTTLLFKFILMLSTQHNHIHLAFPQAAEKEGCVRASHTAHGNVVGSAWLSAAREIPKQCGLMCQ